MDFVSDDHFTNLAFYYNNREFYFWNVPQIQYMNPSVQIVRFLDKTPHPFIRCWLIDGTDVIFDCDSQNKEDILARLVRTIGKTQEMIASEMVQASTDNAAIFGVDRKRFCMCEVPGQCPCPSVIKLPKPLRGKFSKYLKEDLLKEEQEIVEGAKELESFDPPTIARSKFFDP